MARRKLLACAVGALFMTGCVSVPPPADTAPKLAPAYGVRHGGVTPGALVAIGRYFHGQRRYDDALAAYREALAHDPSLADAHNAIGVIHAAQGRLDEAVEAFRAAIALAPSAAHLRNNLGYALLLRGDATARIEFEEALKLDPDNGRARHNLRLARQLNTTPEAAHESAVAAPAGEAPALTIVTANATLATVAPGVYELRSAAPPAEEPQHVPRAVPERRPYKVEVSNGNGVANMARRVADFLARHDIAAGRLTNAGSFREASTQIEYRVGYRDEALALAALLPRTVTIAESHALRSDVHVRLVLGQDVRADVAHFGPAPRLDATRLARTTR